MADLERPPRRLSLWTAILTAIMAAVSLGMAITTPPRSGPFCQADCVDYPYADAAAYVPKDYLWMYPAIALTLLIIVLVQCIHYQIEPDRRVLSGIGVTLSAVGAGTLIIDYAVQLTFIQPAVLFGESEGLSPWSQYNPHGVFIALENVGYGLLNLAFLFIGIAMLRMASRLSRAAAFVLAVGGGFTLTLLVFYSAFYRVGLDYRFEVMAIGLTWLVLIVAPALLSIALVRRRPMKGQRMADLVISGQSLPR
jgi:NADH:ubiquinone oxidoreductase subunit 6 (subunit J)